LASNVALPEKLENDLHLKAELPRPFQLPLARLQDHTGIVLHSLGEFRAVLASVRLTSLELAKSRDQILHLRDAGFSLSNSLFWLFTMASRFATL
jgi:hypothetical protein